MVTFDWFRYLEDDLSEIASIVVSSVDVVNTSYWEPSNQLGYHPSKYYEYTKDFANTNIDITEHPNGVPDSHKNQQFPSSDFCST